MRRSSQSADEEENPSNDRSIDNFSSYTTGEISLHSLPSDIPFPSAYKPTSTKLKVDCMPVFWIVPPYIQTLALRVSLASAVLRCFYIHR
jgi:hypothetical protein